MARLAGERRAGRGGSRHRGPIPGGTEGRRPLMSAHSERGPIVAAESERADIKNIARLVRARRDQWPKLVGPEGEEIELPVSIVRVLRQVVNAMLKDRPFTI